MAEEEDKMLEVKNVSRSFRKLSGIKYKKFKALDDVSFNIEKGKVTALLGINGVGKTTVMKIMAGLIKPDSGEVLVDGEKFNQNSYNKVAFVPDINIHFANTKISEMFEFMEVFYKNWDSEMAEEMLKIFGLNEEDIIDNLSKGNIARVKLIIGFAQKPEYLLLDEPFSGIDGVKREEFISLIPEYMNEDQAIVITTHEISDIENIVDDVIFIDEGKLVMNINAEELRERENLSILEKMREVYQNE